MDESTFRTWFEIWRSHSHGGFKLVKDTNQVVPAVKVQRVGVHAEMQRLAPFRHVADRREGDDGSIEEELAVNALNSR